MQNPILPAPFPWFGGKRKVAGEVWSRFGQVRNYVEPFFGSGAVLLGRPAPVTGTETVNDLDGYVANFWRAIKHAPESVAEFASNPVNENDLHARHVWLLEQRDELREKLEGRAEWYDPKIAGFWAWGVSCWIGSGFCSGKGPWWVDDTGKLVHLGDGGQGVNRNLVHLGDGEPPSSLLPWFQALAARLRRVRVGSGNWLRVCGPSVTTKLGLTGVFLDPPYADTAKRTTNIYNEDSLTIAHSVREWAIEHGENPKMRIALCGYEGEHEMPKSWEAYSWSAGSGFAGQAKGKKNENGKKERIWFSPACLKKAGS